MSDEETPEGAEDELTVPGDVEGDVDFTPFEDDEPFVPRPVQAVMGPDGLATLPDQSAPSDIPALSEDTMICMGDHATFVIRNRWGEILARFKASEVSRWRGGRWRVKMRLAIERAQGCISRERRRTHAGKYPPDASLLAAVASKFVPMPQDEDGFGVQPPRHDDDWFEVEPIRPTCRYYVRQLEHPGAFENAQMGNMLRACAARRNTAGAMMSLRDTGISACSLRDPWIPETENLLDAFDRRKIEQGKNRVHLSIFDSITSAGPPDGEEG